MAKRQIKAVKKSATKAPRAQARPVRQSARGFDAASRGRRTEKWYASQSGINSLLAMALPLMRDRVRDQARNIPWVKRSKRSWVANVIGTGIRPIPQTPDKAFNKALRELWNDQVEVMDADGILDFYGIQTLVAGSFKTAGEVLIRKLYRPTDSFDLPIPLQLQVIEADQLDHRYSQRLDSGGRIIQGVELDNEGQRKFYHLWEEHPSEMESGYAGAKRIKVPASEIIHVFERDRPGQQRGYPGMASSVIRMLDLMEYEDAALVRQKLGAMLVGFITTAGGGDEKSPLGEIENGDVPEAELETGTMQKLDPGQDIKFNEPVEAGSSFEEFFQWQLRAHAADADVTYEMASGDLRNVSFSSIRAGLNEVHRIHEQVQENIFVHQLCRNVWGEFVTLAVKTGAVPMPKDFVASRRKYLRTKWIPDGWPYVSPVDEARANEIDSRNGFTSRTAVVAKKGRNIDDLDQEISDDNDRADALGLSFDSDGRKDKKTGAMDDEPSTIAKEETAPKKPAKKSAAKGRAK
ncbi:MAG: phage portal protein [Alphaproteobacteria bacterium]